jgi:hypothetical protein
MRLFAHSETSGVGLLFAFLSSSRVEVLGISQLSFVLFQGYYRAGYSLLHLLQPYEAARMFFEGLRLLQRSPDQLQVPDFLVGIFTTMSSKSN